MAKPTLIACTATNRLLYACLDPYLDSGAVAMVTKQASPLKGGHTRALRVGAAHIISRLLPKGIKEGTVIV